MIPSLQIGASGLYAAQRAMETAGHNIANVNTPGYTRQRVELTAATPVPGTTGRGDGLRGMGVTVTGVTRLRDDLADTAYRSEADTSGKASARNDVLGRVEQILGPTDGGTPSALSKFWAAWDQLSLTPADASARQAVIFTGQDLAHSLNDAVSQLDTITADTTNKVSGAVDTVNNLLDSVAQLNRSIADVRNGGDVPSDLMDERDRALDQLATLTGATVAHHDDDSVDVIIGSTAVLAGSNVRHLASHTTGPYGGAQVTDEYGNPLALGGQIGGYVDVATVALPDARAQLDQIAQQLVTSVNALHQQGYDLSGDAGGDFFDPSAAGMTARGITVSLTDPSLVAAAAGPPVPGQSVANDGNNALVLAGLRQKAQPPYTSTVDGAVQALAGSLGTQAAAAKQADTAASAALTSLDQQRVASNGVSLDEEMVDLVKYQRSYQAAAKVVSMSDQMLQTLIGMVG